MTEGTERDLPDGWAVVTLNEIASHHSGNSKLIKGKLTSTPEPGLFPAFSATGQDVWVNQNEREGSAIIISAVGARCGKCFRADRKWSAIANTHVVWPHEGVVERDFLWFKINDENFWIRGGSAQPFVKTRESFEQQLLLPPLREQRRIVEKIETLFAELDKGEESLRQVQTLLARYRQSVLKAAVTGELTADWRAERAGKLEHGRDLLERILQTRRETWEGRGRYFEPSPPAGSDLPLLPEGWVWASVGQLANVIGGLTKNSKRASMPLKKPMLRVANVYQNRLDLADVHQIGVTEAELPRVLLQPLDLLVVEGNGSRDQIGRMAVWREEVLDAVHQNHLIKIRMVEKDLVELALWWFQSPNGRVNIEQVASSTSGLYTLSISKIESLAVPLPSVEEAHEISRRVTDIFSQTDQLERSVELEFARSAALRQSILKDAFSGRLVPQDSNDEPAAELLARIRRSQEAGRAAKR